MAPDKNMKKDMSNLTNIGDLKVMYIESLEDKG